MVKKGTLFALARHSDTTAWANMEASTGTVSTVKGDSE